MDVSAQSLFDDDGGRAPGVLDDGGAGGLAEAAAAAVALGMFMCGIAQRGQSLVQDDYIVQHHRIAVTVTVGEAAGKAYIHYSRAGNSSLRQTSDTPPCPPHLSPTRSATPICTRVPPGPSSVCWIRWIRPVRTLP